MPIIEGIELTTRLHFYQWGTHGKKYLFHPNDPLAREIARQSALKQMRAIKWAQSRRLRP
jgi:hypothetical protein